MVGGRPHALDAAAVECRLRQPAGKPEDKSDAPSLAGTPIAVVPYSHSTEQMMTDKKTQAQADQSNMEKDPDDWVTGEEPMTGAQRSYLKTLSEEAKEPFDEQLTKAEASKRIDELQARTGRGQT